MLLDLYEKAHDLEDLFSLGQQQTHLSEVTCYEYEPNKPKFPEFYN